MKQAQEFFESYNQILGKAYDDYFERNGADALKGVRQDDEALQLFLRREMERWENTPSPELFGKTPVEFLNTLGSLDELLELFRAGAVYCDEDFPDCFDRRLKAFEQGAVKALLGFLSDSTLVQDTGDGFLIPLMAVRVLGNWKAAEAVPALVALIEDEGENREVFRENGMVALVSIGKPAIHAVSEALQARGAGTDAGEYLLMALAGIGKNSKSDELYRLLKNMFQTMPNKIIGAICLGNYGDGRAIPALRGYLERNTGSIDRETFYEIKAVIERLGGDTNDLNLIS